MAYFQNPFTSDAPYQLDKKLTDSRLDTAKSFREMVQARTAAGETIDPTEIYQQRLSMAAGDPFAATFIPSGAALSEMTSRANEAATSNRLKISAQTLGFQKTKDDFMADLAKNQYGSTPEEFQNYLHTTVGPDVGDKIFNEYKERIPSILSEARLRKLSEIKQLPIMDSLNDPNDVKLYFANQPKEFQNLAMDAVKDKLRLRAKEDRSETLNVASKVGSADYNNMSPSEQKAMDSLFPNPAAGHQLAMALSSGADLENNRKAMSLINSTTEGMARLEAVMAGGRKEDFAALINAAGGDARVGTPQLDKLYEDAKSGTYYNKVATYKSDVAKEIVTSTKELEAQQSFLLANGFDTAAASIVADAGISDSKKAEAAKKNVVDVFNGVFGSKDAPNPEIIVSDKSIAALSGILRDKASGFNPQTPSSDAIVSAMKMTLSQSGINRESLIRDDAEEKVIKKSGLPPQPAATFLDSQSETQKITMKNYTSNVEKIMSSTMTNKQKQAKLTEARVATENAMNASLQRFNASTQNFSGLTAIQIQAYRDSIKKLIDGLSAITPTVDISKPEPTRPSGDVTGSLMRGYAEENKTISTEREQRANNERLDATASVEIRGIADQLKSLPTASMLTDGWSAHFEDIRAKQAAVASAESAFIEKYGQIYGGADGARQIFHKRLNYYLMAK